MHKQVQGVTKRLGGFHPNAFSADAFQVGGLEIELDPTDQATLSVGPRVSAIQLANKVLDVLNKVVP